MKLSAGALNGLAFAVIVLIWGSTWIAIAKGYEGDDPFPLASLRFLIAAVMLVGVALALRVPLPLSGRPLALSAFVGVVLFGLDYGLIYWGEQYLSSGTTAVLFATMPLCTALVAHWALPNDGLTWRKLGGIAVGIAGMAALFWDSLGGGGVLPMLAIVASALCAALSSVATKKYGHDVHPAGLNAVAMLVGAALLAAAAFLKSGSFYVPRTGAAWVSILYLAVVGSVVAFLLYFWLLKRWPATRISFLALLTPLIALLLGVVYNAESLSPRLGVGAALVLGGVAIATTPARGGAGAAASVSTD